MDNVKSKKLRAESSTVNIDDKVIDRNPRCEHDQEIFGPGGIYKKPCSKLLVFGELTRPWQVRCPRCKKINSKMT